MRHRLDWLSLLLGLVLALVAVAGLNGWITADVVGRDLLLPAGLVLAGLVLAGAAGAVASRLSEDRVHPDPDDGRPDEPSARDPRDAPGPR